VLNNKIIEQISNFNYLSYCYRIFYCQDEDINMELHVVQRMWGTIRILIWKEIEKHTTKIL
jgi:hypothetical protein